jgi:hypothetical protein
MRKTPQWFERLLFHRQTDVNDEGQAQAVRQ